VKQRLVDALCGTGIIVVILLAGIAGLAMLSKVMLKGPRP
jgi:hypothetical protein